jgi:hypothetical protein
MPRGSERRTDLDRLRQLIAAGEGTTDIARQLGVSISTVMRNCEAHGISKPVRFYAGKPARRDRAKR